MSKDNKDFKFHVPVELVKSDNDDMWRVKGIASTGDVDLQGESVDQEGLDISALKLGKGLFNWDHQKGPENILGQIEDGRFIEQDGKKVLEVEGYLFKEHEKAKAIRGIMKSIKKGSAPRVHMSIEGKILARDRHDNGAIKQARIDKVALTLDPVNPYTFAELCKSLNAPEAEVANVNEKVENVEMKAEDEMVEIKKADLEVLVEYTKKALAAGVGYSKSPQARSGGEAMTKESMDKKCKNMTHDEKKKKSKKEMLKSVIDSYREAHPNKEPWDLVETLFEDLLNKESHNAD